MKHTDSAIRPIGITLLLLCLHGWLYCNYLPEQLSKFVAMSTVAILIMFYILMRSKVGGICSVANYIVAALVISHFSAWLFHDQNIVLTWRIAYPWFGICLCFLLYKLKYTQNEIYTGLMIFGGIWMIAYIVSVVSLPESIFRNPYEDSDDLMQRGWYRIYIAGSAVNFLLFYWNLQRYITLKRKSYLVYTIGFMFAIFTTLSRQHILLTSVMFLIIIAKDVNWKRKIAILSLFGVFAFYYVPKTEMYKNLVFLTEMQIDRNEQRDDIRLQAYKYYFGYNKDNYGQILFGNGFYHSNSSYGRKITSIINSSGRILADVGGVAIYFYFGLVGYALFIVAFWKIFKYRKNEEMKFVNYYLFAILAGTIFSNQLNGSMAYVSIALYLLAIQSKDKSGKRNSMLNKTYKDILIS